MAVDWKPLGTAPAGLAGAEDGALGLRLVLLLLLLVVFLTVAAFALAGGLEERRFRGGDFARLAFLPLGVALDVGLALALAATLRFADFVFFLAMRTPLLRTFVRATRTMSRLFDDLVGAAE